MGVAFVTWFFIILPSNTNDDEKSHQKKNGGEGDCSRKQSNVNERCDYQLSVLFEKHTFFVISIQSIFVPEVVRRVLSQSFLHTLQNEEK